MTTATPINGLPYLGQDAPNPRNTFYRRRAPTNSDRRLYKVGDRWIDTAAQSAYILVGKTATTANWIAISGGGSITFNGNVGSATPIAGILNIMGGAGLTVTAAGNTLTITFSAGAPVSSFTVDAFTAPGTNPVVPTAGSITINGSQVAAASFVTGIRTRSIAVSQYNIEVQRSSAAALSTIGLNGVSHFNSAQFTVDANGFVSSLTGFTPWLDSAGGALANHTGYFATAAAVYTLPAGVVNGDMVEIVDFIGGGVVVTAQGGDLIRISNTSSIANGTATSTQLGDALRLVFRAVGQVWVCVPGAAGTWLLA